MARPLPLRTEFDRTRTSSFGYACGACGRCCFGKTIPLNPYEVARLAEHHGLSTTEAIARFTNDCGASLKSREDGGCVFLGEQGCTVHASRPLACRLYPLGRLVTKHEETFAEVVPHPETAGVYGGPGTVADYLASQGAAPFMAASDRYLALFRRMLSTVMRREDAVDASEAASAIVRSSPAEADASMLDVDAVVRGWCEERGIAVPGDVEARVALHIEAVEAQLDDAAGRDTTT
jgi:Fe-S-cluster containining protein